MCVGSPPVTNVTGGTVWLVGRGMLPGEGGDCTMESGDCACSDE